MSHWWNPTVVLIWDAHSMISIDRNILLIHYNILNFGDSPLLHFNFWFFIFSFFSNELPMQVTIKHADGKRQVELNDYSPSGIWDIIDVPSELIHSKSKIAYHIRIRRYLCDFSPHSFWYFSLFYELNYGSGQDTAQESQTFFYFTR